MLINYFNTYTHITATKAEPFSNGKQADMLLLLLLLLLLLFLLLLLLLQRVRHRLRMISASPAAAGRATVRRDARGGHLREGALLLLLSVAAALRGLCAMAGAGQGASTGLAGALRFLCVFHIATLCGGENAGKAELRECAKDDVDSFGRDRCLGRCRRIAPVVRAGRDRLRVEPGHRELVVNALHLLGRKRLLGQRLIEPLEGDLKALACDGRRLLNLPQPASNLRAVEAVANLGPRRSAKLVLLVGKDQQRQP
jgi:hypothetical protein